MKFFACILLILYIDSSNFKTEGENPALYYGTTFGHYFQILHRLGKYEEMLALTSSQTIEKFGEGRLLDFYQKMDFSYKLKLKARNGNILHYETQIFATKKTLKFGLKLFWCAKNHFFYHSMSKSHYLHPDKGVIS
jgi:hypothetical protein